MTNDFSRNYTRTNIVPIKSDLTGLAAREQYEQQISESNRLAREQWAAAQANQERREQQDKALAYLATKQMEKDAGFLSRLRRLFQ
jgi:DNA primase